MKDFFAEAVVKKINKKKIVTAIIVVIIAIILVSLCVLYTVNKEFREWSDVNIFRKEVQQDSVSTIDFNTEANAEICAYDRYIGILSKNTLQLYNGYGKEEAKLDVPINDVIFNSCGRFLGIAEKEGKKAYLISGKEMVWENEIDGNISQISVNRNGYTAIVISNTSYKTVVNLYDNTGKQLFTIYLSNTRVSSLSISNDNKFLALAEIDTTSSLIQSKVKVISIENAQKDPEGSVVYVNNVDSNKLLTNISYKDKNKLVCLYDNSVEIIFNDECTELVNFSEKKIGFISIELNNTVAIIEEKASGLFTADSEIELISVANQKETSYTVEEVTKEIYTCGDNIALNVGSELHFINTGGWLVKRYLAHQEITNVVMSEYLAGVIYRDKIEIVML